jgi:tetrapyrrole methylase family protein / MazG family protein
MAFMCRRTFARRQLSAGTQSKGSLTVIIVIGLGPGPISLLTKEAEKELLHADKIFFRTCAHPVYDWLRGLEKQLICFDDLYAAKWTEAAELYQFMTDALLKEVRLRGKAVFALPGSPVFLESTTRFLQQRSAAEKIEFRVVHGLSFLELALAEADFDVAGLQILLPLAHLQGGRYRADSPLMVCQIEARSQPLDKPRVDLTMKWLLRKYPPDHAVTLIWTDGPPEYTTQSRTIPLKNLAGEYAEGKYYASVYVPPLGRATGS